MLDSVVSDAQTAGEVSPPAVAKSALKGIAILGSHPATVMAAPFDQADWLVYACSPDNTPFGASGNARTLPRVDQWFELHAPIEDPSRPYGYLQAVAQMPFVWMRDQRALASGLFKGARAYPETELYGTVSIAPDQKSMVPKGDGLFCPYMFTSSIAYMLAKAIVDCEAQGIKRIGLWGIMQASENEFTYQRPGVQYMIWQATQRGIKVVANRESRLFDMPQWKW